MGIKAHQSSFQKPNNEQERSKQIIKNQARPKVNSWKRPRKEGEVRIPSGCAVSGVCSREGKTFSCDAIVNSITAMHQRSNGLGGGFAVYGLYPERKGLHALHVLFDNPEDNEGLKERIKAQFKLVDDQPLPVKPSSVDEPYFHRYFVKSKGGALQFPQQLASFVMEVNSKLSGVYIFSCGENMGVFKGVGYPEEMAEFFKLHTYQGYTWIAHGRFPTNTPGWWGGAHPFSLLDWSVVHNGELSSYGINRRFLEMYGYQISLQTDTEVIAYALDLLVRRHGVPLKLVSKIFAPPFWEEIEKMPQREAEAYRAIRSVYGSLLLNGPFSIIVGFKEGMMALNDRLKLRSLVAAEGRDYYYLASEEAAIRAAAQDVEKLYYPQGGQAVLYSFQEGTDH